jgi:hypothetical protein
MCSFWAGGISSFPFSRAREYRLLRRLEEQTKGILKLKSISKYDHSLGRYNDSNFYKSAILFYF